MIIVQDCLINIYTVDQKYYYFYYNWKLNKLNFSFILLLKQYYFKFSVFNNIDLKILKFNFEIFCCFTINI